MSTYPTKLAKPKQIRAALSFYRVMAIVAGIALFILIAEMVMKYAFKMDNFLTENWSYIHGFIYMAYAVSVANLGLKSAWSLVRIVKNLLVGFVPVLPWVVEPKVDRETNALLERAYVAADANSAEDSQRA